MISMGAWGWRFGISNLYAYVSVNVSAGWGGVEKWGYYCVGLDGLLEPHYVLTLRVFVAPLRWGSLYVLYVFLYLYARRSNVPAERGDRPRIVGSEKVRYLVNPSPARKFERSGVRALAIRRS